MQNIIPSYTYSLHSKWNAELDIFTASIMFSKPFFTAIFLAYTHILSHFFNAFHRRLINVIWINLFNAHISILLNFFSFQTNQSFSFRQLQHRFGFCTLNTELIYLIRISAMDFLVLFQSLSICTSTQTPTQQLLIQNHPLLFFLPFYLFCSFRFTTIIMQALTLNAFNLNVASFHSLYKSICISFQSFVAALFCCLFSVVCCVWACIYAFCLLHSVCPV